MAFWSLDKSRFVKVPRIKKNREWEMSHSGQCKNNLNFHKHYEAAEKIKQKSWSCLEKSSKKLRADEKNNKKVKTSQSVELSLPRIKC